MMVIKMKSIYKSETNVKRDAVPWTRAEPRARGRASARAPHAGGWRGRARC